MRRRLYRAGKVLAVFYLWVASVQFGVLSVFGVLFGPAAAAYYSLLWPIAPEGLLTLPNLLVGLAIGIFVAYDVSPRKITGRVHRTVNDRG